MGAASEQSEEVVGTTLVGKVMMMTLAGSSGDGCESVNV